MTAATTRATMPAVNARNMMSSCAQGRRSRAARSVTDFRRLRHAGLQLRDHRADLRGVGVLGDRRKQPLPRGDRALRIVSAVALDDADVEERLAVLRVDRRGG